MLKHTLLSVLVATALVACGKGGDNKSSSTARPECR